MTVPDSEETLPVYYFDTNGDNFVSPIDALVTINRLNQPAAVYAEGEANSPIGEAQLIRPMAAGTSQARIAVDTTQVAHSVDVVFTRLAEPATRTRPAQNVYSGDSRITRMPFSNDDILLDASLDDDFLLDVLLDDDILLDVLLGPVWWRSGHS